MTSSFFKESHTRSYWTQLSWLLEPQYLNTIDCFMVQATNPVSYVIDPRIVLFQDCLRLNACTPCMDCFMVRATNPVLEVIDPRKAPFQDYFSLNAWTPCMDCFMVHATYPVSDLIDPRIALFQDCLSLNAWTPWPVSWCMLPIQFRTSLIQE